MPKHTKQKPKTSRKLLYIKLAWVVAGIVVLIVFDLGFAGNGRFYTKVVECKGWPYQGYGPGFLNSPMYYHIDNNLVSIRGSRYFCTPLEAEKAGYSANDTFRQYPHLEAERAKQRGE